MKRMIIKLHKNRIKLSGRSLATLAVVILFIIALMSIIRTNIEIKHEREELIAIQAQCEAQSAENDSLKMLLGKFDDTTGYDEEFIEEKARENDYVLPGERVYIIRAGN